MMRIAIAGSGGLSQIFASYIDATAHPFIILSREARPQLTARGFQVIVVNYDSQTDLRYHLRGVDLVISTISGNPQINLIDAAAHSGVRRFVPAEFEGPPARRPRNDPLDRGRAACLDRLRHWNNDRHHRMRFTVFCCGVFYERFARGGLAAMGVGLSTTVAFPGSYLMNIQLSTAETVEHNTAGQPIYLCLTSVHDVARFLVAALALDVQTWPAEFRMFGDRRTVLEVVQRAEAVKGGTLFSTEIIPAADLQAHFDYATYCQDFIKAGRIQELIATEQKRYDFTQPNLNELVDVVPTSFWDWMQAHWGAR